VLVYDNIKADRLGRRLPISETTAAVITGQQDRIRARFPHCPPRGDRTVALARQRARDCSGFASRGELVMANVRRRHRAPRRTVGQSLMRQAWLCWRRNQRAASTRRLRMRTTPTRPRSD
jgi:hypothetical protein